jgi:aminobenzoyl-glutamate utilization protein B
MQRAGLRGTIKLWPGGAEEQLAGKAHLVRARYFKDVDVVLFTPVSDNLEVAWGTGAGTSLVPVEHMFRGETAPSGDGAVARTQRAGRG